MNTQENDAMASKIAVLLDQGTQQLDSAIAAKLLEARKEALAHYQEQSARAWAPQLAGVAGRLVEPFGLNLRSGVMLLAFAASLAAVVIWHNASQQGSDIAEIDEALLTDELPITAYLDKGFDSWLKRP